MSLRIRLILSFTALLLTVIAVVGAVAVGSTRSVLIHQIDQRLAEAARRGDRFPPGDVGPGGRNLAQIVVSPAGEVLFQAPSGFAGAPDPLPELDDLGTLPPGLRFANLPAEDRSFHYRALIARSRDGIVVILAAPLREVAAARAALIRTLFLSGAGVLLLGGAATWWTVRRGLRPVDRMVDTAAAIAAGDLSRRVPDSDPNTELGRLGAALNDMLGKIERAFAAEAEAKERLRQFVADASHELRTPIAAIRGYAELQRKGALSEPEEIGQAMHRIQRESNRMQHLVDDLLLLARLDQDQPLNLAPVDLVAVVGDVVTDQRAIDPDRPVTIDIPDSSWVTGDEQRLTQVVANLLANARAHTPPGTPVHVTLRNGADAVALEVTDDGPGIPPKAVDRIFDRFYRVDASRSRRRGGSGLGLAIVAAIVAAHGGTVTASNPPGHGARVTMTLPGETPILR
jgi:two-component system, OmpR family, sensor kinase